MKHASLDDLILATINGEGDETCGAPRYREVLPSPPEPEPVQLAFGECNVIGPDGKVIPALTLPGHDL